MSKKTRRHHTPDQKIAMLRRHHLGKEPAADSPRRAPGLVAAAARASPSPCRRRSGTTSRCG